MIDVFTQSPEHRHGHVAMGIDHARHHDIAAQIANVRALGLRRDTTAQPNDPVAFDQQPAWTIFRHRRVHGNDPAIGQKCLHSGLRMAH